MLERGTPNTPHFLYHLLVIWIYQLTGQTSWQMSVFVANLSGLRYITLVNEWLLSEI